MLEGHGGDIHGLAKRLGRSPGEILDFSSNCSPLPLDQGLKALLSSLLDEVRWLPEVTNQELREALSRRHGLSAECILPAGGTTEWIYGLAELPGIERAIIPQPTYSDYADAARLAGLTVESPAFMTEKGPVRDAQWLCNEISKAIQARSIVYLCNPNNPTGLFIPLHLIEALIDAHPGALFVLDESYVSFIGPDESVSAISFLARKKFDNLVILRSFSKIQGIPGLRVGYAVVPPSLVQVMKEKMRPWSVNRLGQLAATHLAGRLDLEERVMRFCSKERDWLCQQLSKIPALRPMPLQAHFFLVHLAKSETVRGLSAALEESGIAIRDCSNFRSMPPGFFRISPGLRPANETLVARLKGLLS